MTSVPKNRRYMDILEILSCLFLQHGYPEHLRCDNGSEFTVLHIREWLHEAEGPTLNIESGRLWKNGYYESFNSKMRDEFLNCGVF